MRVLLTSEPDGRCCLHSPYDPEFVAGLKQAIPAFYRTWVKERRCWLIADPYIRHLLIYLDRTGVEIEDDREPATIAHRELPSPVRQAFDVLYCAYTAPLTVVEGAYRALVKVHHPDKGGSVETCAQLNKAIATVRQHLSHT